ncbi:DUF2339 domain-containing protein [Saccharothrix obliqua]|uniref:DUF2339 domain-containing protein n=1 Tax=Saccharothrix obliqua TaxID=2861747 RepID=UPI001C5F6D30|nr:DUF2339 domain-containing protein [Saccharothrix obliqua]MBW4719452.1 DUF2339 domain-containing protein [Saccharothrix obliqua]
MTGPDPLIRLADELGHLGRRLEAVGLELKHVAAPTALLEPGPARPTGAEGEPTAAEPPAAAEQGAAEPTPAAAGQGAAEPAAAAGQAAAEPAAAEPTPAEPTPARAEGPAEPSGAAGLPDSGAVRTGAAEVAGGQAGAGRPGGGAAPAGAGHVARPATPFSAWSAPGPWAGQPGGWPPRPSTPPPPPPPYAPYAPQQARPTLIDRLGKPGAGSRLLAWVGGAVTLLGVVMLLVLAVQRGYLGPVPRVVGGAVLGAVLVGVALRLHRGEHTRVGAFAVAATGFAVLYLDVVAATSIYRYLPEGAGLALGLAVAVGGLVLAMRWDSAAFAVGVVGACAVCAPILTHGFPPLLVAFLLVLKIAASPVQLRRAWPSLAVTAGVPPLLAAVVSIGQTDDPRVLAGMALLAAVVGVAAAVATAWRRPGDAVALGLAVGSPMPALLTTTVLDRPWAAGLAGAVAFVMLLLWAVGLRTLPKAFTAGVGGVGLLALLLTTAIALDGSARAAAVLGEALVLAFLARQLGSRSTLAGSAVFGVIGLGMALVDAVPPGLLLAPPRRPVAEGALVTGAVTALALLVLAVFLPWAAVHLGVLRRHPLPWVVVGLVALYAAAGVVLCSALLVSQSVTGFVFGHSVVTVSWTVAALVLLVRGIDTRSLRVAGLVLVGAAVAKLVLFDLSRLDGIARVLAFIGAGLVLLTAGTRYAKLVATRRISANS